MYSDIAAVLATSLWAGVVLGVSFVAQPAKFSTPGLARPIALATGRQMFQATQVLESCLSILAITLLMITGSRLRWPTFSAGAILVLQILVLMPPLSERVNARLTGKTLAASPWHALFGISEVLKFLLLLTAAICSLLHTSASQQ
ncbi:hypothetical protein GTP46_08245 [Duganella sp. FT135W]|uniref:DUF4149 domain-containing protein n=1 Tax=Duganella flavida TaxID=2692175 RepID=A0A6L8K9Y0_9BURK|nr:hypothetical protein [Duganella flavida]MYM22634.1 hypothetical protein [Duganella flavida]